MVALRAKPNNVKLAGFPEPVGEAPGFPGPGGPLIVEMFSLVAVPDYSHIPEVLRELMQADTAGLSVAAEVDARGLTCPLPLLRAKQALRPLAAGELLRVWATDSGSLKDFAAFAQLTGQVVLEGFDLQDGAYCYLIRKQSS